jgi:hypothetical protein
MGYPRYNKDGFIAKSKEVYGDFYDYSKVVWVKATTKVEIICPKHGSFSQQPTVHIDGRGCRKCGDERIRKAQAFTTEIFLDMVKDRLDFGYDYSKVQYVNMHKKVEIVCKEHGSFFMRPEVHILNRGCPTCNARKSNRETDWLNSIGLADSPSTRNVRLHINDGVGTGWIITDGYDKATNTIYEFWGDYWHGNPKLFKPDAINTHIGKTFGELYEKTQKKRQRLVQAGYNLVDIWESDYINQHRQSCYRTE